MMFGVLGYLKPIRVRGADGRTKLITAIILADRDDQHRKIATVRGARYAQSYDKDGAEVWTIL